MVALKHITEGLRKGSFEDLTFYIGTAFRKEIAQQTDNVLVKDVSEGGLFRWTPAAKQLAGKIPHGSSITEKQLHMVALLLENFDDLMIEPRYNVSESAGWDPFHAWTGPEQHGDNRVPSSFPLDMRPSLCSWMYTYIH